MTTLCNLKKALTIQLNLCILGFGQYDDVSSQINHTSKLQDHPRCGMFRMDVTLGTFKLFSCPVVLMLLLKGLMCRRRMRRSREGVISS